LLNRCKPDLIIDRLENLDQQMLLDRGIKGMLLDLDNTLCPWGSREVSDPRREWIVRAKESFRLCIVSNTFKGKRLCAVGEDLSIPTVSRWGFGRKPFGGAIKAGLKITGTKACDSVIIGDQIFADILGGNSAGLMTVWIPPLNQREFISTMCVRGAERAVLKRLGCEIPLCPEPEND
jgi:HAD superfamily phosphatase (TIGR01668 family)